MSKLTEFLTDAETGSVIPSTSLTQHYVSQVMHMRQCEARDWLKRYRTMAAEHGATQANQWWRKTIMDIERIRGLEAATELRNLMNLERKK